MGKRVGDQSAGGNDLEQFWWCLKHNAVEQGPVCPGKVKLGPFDCAEDAARALELVRERNEQWQAHDGPAEAESN